MDSHVPGKVQDTLIAILEVAGVQSTGQWSVLRQSYDYWIISVEVRSSRGVLVKIAAEDSAIPSFEAARAKNALVRELVEVPVASILVADDSCSHVPMRFSVQELLAGEEWFTRRTKLLPEQQEEALAKLGDVVGRLHRPNLQAFGDLLCPIEEHCVVALKDHARKIIGNERLQGSFLDLLDKAAHLWNNLKPGITHDDLHGFNILFDPNWITEVSGLLDFDKAWSGPVESDLARMELWRGMTSPTFLERYRHHVPELDGYADRRPYYQLLWCLEYAQNSKDHLATTNTLANRLRMPAVAEF